MRPASFPAPVYGWFSEGFDTLDFERGQDVARMSCTPDNQFQNGL
jgi:hypothetical protein